MPAEPPGGAGALRPGTARLVLIDIDGTLVRPPSTERRFFRQLRHSGHNGLPQMLAYGFAWVLWLPRFGARTAQKNKTYLTGLSVDAVSALAQEWASGALDDAWRDAILARLREHQARGDVVALLSGTPDFIASAIAKRLGVERYIGSDCPTRGDRFRFGLPSRHPFRRAKLAIAQRLAADMGIDASAVIAYGDSVHDAPLLDWAGTAVAVSADRRLAALAQRKGWETLSEPARRRRRAEGRR